MTYTRNTSLKSYNTFGMEVKADALLFIEQEEDLIKAYQDVLPQFERSLMLGGGSNVLFTQDFKGIVLVNRIRGLKILAETKESIIVEAGAGENWHGFVMHCVQQGWGGIENLALIPGTVGAAPVQNIGAYGVELRDVFHSLHAWDTAEQKFVEMTADDCNFGYRDSIFKQGLKGRMVITYVRFCLSKIHKPNLEYGAIRQQLDQAGIKSPDIRDVANMVIQIRKSKLPDPVLMGNAGSFFKNPVVSVDRVQTLREQFPDLVAFPSGSEMKVAAGWLIEKVGWKGYRSGDAGCHDKQALVLVNHGHATGKEILELSRQIIVSVQERFGVVLEPEVNIL